jgi:DnaA family protein
MKQLPLAIGPVPEPAFDNFVAGPNAGVLAQLRAAAASEPVLYVWGPSGCGKTHLLRALARERTSGCGFFAAATPSPWGFDAAWPLVLLDECDAYDAARQQAAFTLFVDAATHGVPIAAAGRLPPVDLPLRDDLRSRLGSGPVFALQPLADADARAALRSEARRRGIVLGDEVVDYLLTRFARDLKHLMTLLDRLDGYALEQQRGITVPLLRRMLSEEGAA